MSYFLALLQLFIACASSTSQCFLWQPLSSFDIDCSHPCYKGLEPNKQSAMEVLFVLPHILKIERAFDVDYFIPGDRAFFDLYWTSGITGNRVSLLLINGTLHQITVELYHPIRLEDAITQFGEPMYSFFEYLPPVSGTSLLIPEYGRLQITHLFPQQGIILGSDDFILDVYGVTAICEDDPIINVTYTLPTESETEFLLYAYNMSHGSVDSYLYERAPYTGENGWRGFDARLALARNSNEFTRLAGYDALLCEIKQRLPYQPSWNLPENLIEP